MRLCKRLPILFLTAAMPALLLACGGDAGDDNPGDVDSGPAVCTPQGDHTYVIDKVNIPQNTNEATSLYAFDLNDDGTPNNKVGGVLVTLQSVLNLDVSGSVDKAINQGTAILLVNLQSADLDNASCAGTTIYLGANPDPAPCADEEDTVCSLHLDGNGQFDIAAGSPTEATVLGRIINGAFEGGPDLVAGAAGEPLVLELPVIEGAAPLRLSLIGARIEIKQVSADGLVEGRLGGAVLVEDLETSVLPTLHGFVEEIIAADCTGTPETECCEDPNSQGAQILTFFDENKDCQVPLEELKDNAVISNLLTADMDLLDADGGYAPDKDGEKESLSVGLGFSATTATFSVP